jgi:hypothetical protein
MKAFFPQLQRPGAAAGLALHIMTAACSNVMNVFI